MSDDDTYVVSLCDDLLRLRCFLRDLRGQTLDPWDASAMAERIDAILADTDPSKYMEQLRAAHMTAGSQS
jgi:hypothetical protein